MLVYFFSICVIFVAIACCYSFVLITLFFFFLIIRSQLNIHWVRLDAILKWDKRHPQTSVQYVTKLLCVAEYVNAQEVPMDMKSITDRAAQTLLWTELFRGQLHALFNTFVKPHL